MLVVGALADTTNYYFVVSLIHAYFVSICKLIEYAPAARLLNVAVTDVSDYAETVPVILYPICSKVTTIVVPVNLLPVNTKTTFPAVAV